MDSTTALNVVQHLLTKWYGVFSFMILSLEGTNKRSTNSKTKKQLKQHSPTNPSHVVVGRVDSCTNLPTRTQQ